LQAGKTTLIALALLATAACSRPASNAAASADAAAASSEQQYQAAPDLTGASPTGDGRVELAGRASPGAAVRLTSPGAAPQFAAADPQGAWRLTIPPSAQPRLFGLSMSAGGRVVQAIGYLFVAPGAVARLRVGGGTQALASASHGGLAGVALDYDSKRAATLSGLASPGETVGLRADGVERGQAAADQAGRFVIALNGEPLAAGAHDFELLSPSGALRFSAELDAPTPLAGTPYAARRQGAAWRVDWITPGGGEQTTLIFERGGGAA
jgi:hypothetical protein